MRDSRCRHVRSRFIGGGVPLRSFVCLSDGCLFDAPYYEELKSHVTNIIVDECLRAFRYSTSSLELSISMKRIDAVVKRAMNVSDVRETVSVFMKEELGQAYAIYGDDEWMKRCEEMAQEWDFVFCVKPAK